MYGAINGSFINFGGLNAAGGEAINIGISSYTQENQVLNSSTVLAIECIFDQTEANDTLNAEVSLPIIANLIYQQENQVLNGNFDVLGSAVVQFQEENDTLFAFFENTMVRKSFGSGLTPHTGGSSLTPHAPGSRIEEVH